MSRLTTGISGVIALTVISCAAQYALGRDLSPIALGQPQIDQPLPASFTALAVVGTLAVNRGAKADRTVAPAGSPALTRTVSLKLDGFSATTFLLRLPLVDGGPASVAPRAKSGAARQPMVACEPVVSVLTDVVNRLQPGRCVT
jgi:hypothetical protein